jgi:general secretion pathway protein B
MKVGGVMYSDTPESRVLVINDQVLREGESVQPGLVLEHIGPKSAKLRWKDQLLEVPY